uniref:C1q domain-containing protein n=1 Tax=Cyprinus carpio TaxID=7962 RepID=A0A8C2EQ42_CYPCA
FLQNEIKALTCPLQICTDLLQELGATLEKLQATETDFSVKCVSKKWYHIELKQLAFSASLGSNGFFGPDVTLVYKNVFIYVGDAYQQATGIFTAPLKGAYMFSFSIYGLGSSSTASTVSIVKNGERVVVAHGHQDQYSVNSSKGVVLILEVGDVVYVRLWSGTRIFDNQNKHTTFSGYLLFPLR